MPDCGQAWPIYQHYVDPEAGQAVGDVWAYQPYTEETVFGLSTRSSIACTNWGTSPR